MSSKKKSAVIWVLAAVCLVLSVLLLARWREDRQDELVYMNNLYADLRSIMDYADNAEPEQVQPEDLEFLRWSLRSVADQLTDGAQYVNDCVPSAAAFWFDQTAESVEEALLLSPDGGLTEEGVAFLEQLGRDMHFMVDSLVGEDGLNRNQQLTIEDFSNVIFSFYWDR